MDVRRARAENSRTKDRGASSEGRAPGPVRAAQGWLPACGTPQTPAIEGFEVLQLVEIQRGETVQLHAAEIATRTLDPKHRGLGARQGIAHHKLGRRISAPEVRNPLVGAE